MSALAELLKAPGASIELDDDFDAVNELMRGVGWKCMFSIQMSRVEAARKAPAITVPMTAM